MNDTPQPGKTDRPANNPSEKRAKVRVLKPGNKKVFPREAGSSNGTSVVSNNSDSLAFTMLSLPIGPVIQIHSPRMRNSVDTFLKNTSHAHTVIRSILQGPDGGFQGDMDAIILGLVEKDICSAVLAIRHGRRWFVHSRNNQALEQLITSVPRGYRPSGLEGHSDVVQEALHFKPVSKNKPKQTREYVHYSMAPRIIPMGAGGHNRLAQTSDITRLEEYAENLNNEVGVTLLDKWDSMIAENRIMLGVVEGTVASVAIRAAETIDQILIDGIYTFKPFRRRGMASRLIATMARQAAGRGQSSGVIVRANNAQMIKLLEKLEFQRDTDYTIVTF